MIRNKIKKFRTQKIRAQGEPPRMTFRGGSFDYTPSTRTVVAFDFDKGEEITITGIDIVEAENDLDTAKFENGKMSVSPNSVRDVFVTDNGFFA